jgi:glycosyltransferase involved in cell wall biosynthesis
VVEPAGSRPFLDVRGLLTAKRRREVAIAVAGMSTTGRRTVRGRGEHPRPEHMSRTTVALLSTYPPTQCGLATFTAALYEQLSRSPGHVGVVSVLDGSCDGNHGPEVVAHLFNGRPASVAAAVSTMNEFQTVIVQHEYGIYGGPDGLEIVDLVEALTSPTIMVLHTVLLEPTRRQKEILERLVASADVVVTMADTARQRLVEQYGVDPAGVTVIPHGAIDHRDIQIERSDGERPVILTWGLLGPGKGIEWAIAAMPELRDLHPRYLVVGKTHPKVLERDGEQYRRALAARATALGVGDLVEIDGSYLSVTELARLVASADVVLLPYDSPDQVTSGVLIEAVAAGRPIVSTGFPHAVELMTPGSGIIVPQRDPGAVSAALRRVLAEPGLAEKMAAQAASQAPSLVWSAVGQRYRELASRLVTRRLVTAS